MNRPNKETLLLSHFYDRRKETLYLPVHSFTVSIDKILNSTEIDAISIRI